MSARKKNKILFIVEADLTSGSGKCALELVRLLSDKSNFEPVVVTQYQNNLNTACDKLSIENYHTHYARTCSLGMGRLGWFIAFFCRPFLNFLSFKKLKKHIDFCNVCIIHSNSSSIDFGAYLHRKLQIPHIWHIREFLVFNHIWPAIVSKIPNYIVKNSSCVITVSKQLKEFLQDKTKSTNIKAIYDGVYSSSNTITPHAPNDSGRLRLVCIGNLAPIKGQDTLLEAVSLLPPQVLSNISLDFYGLSVGDFEQKLKQIVQKASLESVVHFKGFCNNVLDILTNYDVGIQPSHTEGFSRVPVEYMLAGLCVIGNGETSISELVENNKNGLLYKDYDIQSLANKIAYCFYNRKEMNVLGQTAQKMAKERFCIEQNVSYIIDEYNSLGCEKC